MRVDIGIKYERWVPRGDPFDAVVPRLRNLLQYEAMPCVHTDVVLSWAAGILARTKGDLPLAFAHVLDCLAFGGCDLVEERAVSWHLLDCLSMKVDLNFSA